MAMGVRLRPDSKVGSVLPDLDAVDALLGSYTRLVKILYTLSMYDINRLLNREMNDKKREVVITRLHARLCKLKMVEERKGIFKQMELNLRYDTDNR